MDDVGMRRLQQLTPEQAVNWVQIGSVLRDLEAISRAAPSGRSWQELLRARLEELGAPVSSGHLYKIRRAANFLFEQAPEHLPEEALQEAKISAVEVAERLFRLQPHEGRKALADALGTDPATFVELQARYEHALKSAPHMRSPRQLAWQARRGAESNSVDKKEPVELKAEQSAVRAMPEKTPEGPSDALLSQSKDLLSRAWSEGWHAAEVQLRSAIQEKDAEIAALREAVTLQMDEAASWQQEAQVLAAKVRELGGDEYDE